MKGMPRLEKGERSAARQGRQHQADKWEGDVTPPHRHTATRTGRVRRECEFTSQRRRGYNLSLWRAQGHHYR
jgi:hypothetical protein